MGHLGDAAGLGGPRNGAGEAHDAAGVRDDPVTLETVSDAAEELAVLLRVGDGLRQHPERLQADVWLLSSADHKRRQKIAGALRRGRRRCRRVKVATHGSRGIVVGIRRAAEGWRVGVTQCHAHVGVAAGGILLRGVGDGLTHGVDAEQLPEPAVAGVDGNLDEAVVILARVTEEEIQVAPHVLGIGGEVRLFFGHAHHGSV